MITKLRKLVKAWRDAALRSRITASQVNHQHNLEWSTELMTNANDLEMCADQLEKIIRKPKQ